MDPSSNVQSLPSLLLKRRKPPRFRGGSRGFVRMAREPTQGYPPEARWRHKRPRYCRYRRVDTSMRTVVRPPIASTYVSVAVSSFFSLRAARGMSPCHTSHSVKRKRSRQGKNARRVHFFLALWNV